MRNKKNTLIGGLIAAVVLMAVGYAALSQELEIFGTATIDAEWNVEFTSITRVDDNGITELVRTFDATTATFEVDLHYPGAFAEYDIVVTNSGTIDARVGTINVNQSSDVADVTFTVSGIQENDELDSTDTHTVTVRVEWTELATEIPEDPDLIQETLEVTILYVQNTD